MLYEYSKTMRIPGVLYGFSEVCDVRALSWEQQGDLLCTEVDAWGKNIHLETHALGRHMVYAMLAAYAIGKKLGLDDAALCRGIASFTPTELRMNIYKNEKYTILDDSYNASPASMKAAIDVLEAQKGGRHVAILGDMFEMGEQAEEAHRRVGRFLAGQTKVQTAILIGAQARWMYEEVRKNPAIQCYYFETTKEMEKKAFDILQKNDIILVKASHGMRLDLVSSYILDRK